MSHQKAIKTTWLSILGNTLLALVKWIAGYFGNSYALIADAIESTTDIFSSLLVLLGLKYSSKPADANHPYGHGRVEPLVTFIVVGFLVAAATVIAFESIINIQTPHQLPKPYTLIVLAVIIICKELFYRYVSKKSDEVKSVSLKADAWHHRSDAITSLAAFIGIGIAVYFGNGYEAADDWAALIASGFIYYNSYLIFRPALGEIMDEHVYDDVIEDIRKTARTVDGVLNTEKCYVRKSGLHYHVDLHITVNANITVKEGHRISHLLKDKLMKELPHIADVLIHIEPDEHT
jgi:cation diffusion facilitator family transporter